MHCDATTRTALIRRWAVRRRRVLQLAEFAPKFVVRAEVRRSRESSSTGPPGAVKRPTVRVTERRTRPRRYEGLGRTRRSPWRSANARRLIRRTHAHSANRANLRDQAAAIAFGDACDRRCSRRRDRRAAIDGFACNSIDDRVGRPSHPHQPRGDLESWGNCGGRFAAPSAPDRAQIRRPRIRAHCADSCARDRRDDRFRENRTAIALADHPLPVSATTAEQAARDDAVFNEVIARLAKLTLGSPVPG